LVQQRLPRGAFRHAAAFIAHAHTPSSLLPARGEKESHISRGSPGGYLVQQRLPRGAFRHAAAFIAHAHTPSSLLPASGEKVPDRADEGRLSTSLTATSTHVK
jgi:hypothetical protein